MIKMSMGDEQEILMNSPRQAPPNVKHGLQFRHNNASLVATKRNPLDRIPFQTEPFTVDLGPSFPVLFVFDCSADCGQEPRTF